MTSPTTLTSTDREALRTALGALPEVVHIDIDPAERRIWVIQDPQMDPDHVEQTLRAHCAELGYALDDYTIRSALPAGARRRRVRLAAAEREERGKGRVRVAITLEWRGEAVTGEAMGDKGEALELKTAALATLAAIESVMGEELDLRLIGIKPMHAFDADLMVASLLRRGSERQRLVGAVVVRDEPLRAVAIAVLNALNRVLGNYLYTTD